MPERTFRICRGNASGGEFREYRIEEEPGMVVLDGIHRIQSSTTHTGFINNFSGNRQVILPVQSFCFNT